MRIISGGASLIGAAAGLVALGLAGTARADQFIVTDVTYTHSADTTSDSHYRVAPSSTTPSNWTKPTDWTNGSVHVLLEVKTKPSDTPTKFQICFEGSPSYACTFQSDTYTKPGTYQWSTPFGGMWSPAGEPMQWASGVKKVALILKDTNNGKPQGDPKYVPTDLHVEVAVVSAGASYEPAMTVVDAGSADASEGDAGATSSGADAAVDTAVDAAATDAGSPRADGSTTRRDASVQPPFESGSEEGPARDGGEPPSDASAAAPGTSSSSGCALPGHAGSGSWLALLALAFVRRRRAPRSA